MNGNNLKHLIKHVDFIVAGRLTTICILFLYNGSEVIGKYTNSDPLLAFEDTDKQIAYEDAFKKLEEFDNYYKAIGQD